MASNFFIPRHGQPARIDGEPKVVKLWDQDTAKGRFTSAGFTKETLNAFYEANADYLGKEPIAGVWPKLALRIESRHEPNDYFAVGAMFVISDRIRAILEGFPVKAEYFHMDVTYRRKPFKKREYFFAHLLDHVDCFDFKKSKYTLHDDKERWSHEVDTIEKLVIDEKKAAGRHLFVLDRVSNFINCASDELAEKIEASGVTGVRFAPPIMWNRGFG